MSDGKRDKGIDTLDMVMQTQFCLSLSLCGHKTVAFKNHKDVCVNVALKNLR